MMVTREFGAAGDEVVIEQSLRGWETSAHAFCDGKTAVMMPFASDHKRALDGDHGANTGGMGAYSPSERVTPGLTAAVQTEVVDRVLAGMAAEGAPFAGTLFPGMMVTADGPYVLEFNARLGDPEAQVLMPRLGSDLYAVCRAAADGCLADCDVAWSSRPTVGVVMASGGYPATYKVGYKITGLDELDPDVMAFHAGTAQSDRGLVTSGGRVLTVVASGATLAEARTRAYENVRRIRFSDAHYRTDIGPKEPAPTDR
jgi:phosphoribosylamine--glycine ligase